MCEMHCKTRIYVAIEGSNATITTHKPTSSAGDVMINTHRQTEILEAVRERGNYSVVDLAKRLTVSTETIRRNLRDLVKQGLLVKFHGGVALSVGSDELPFQRRMQLNGSHKRAVAAAAAARINDGDTILLDSGTTTAYVAEALMEHANLVIVTNSAHIACRLSQRNGNRVFLAGGEVNPEGLAVFGAPVNEFLRQFQVRYALISVGGVSARGEFSVFHLWEAEFTQTAIGQADEAWLIVDHTKFGRDAPVRAGDISQLKAVFTDKPMPANFAERFSIAGVEVRLPAEEVV